MKKQIRTRPRDPWGTDTTPLEKLRQKMFEDSKSRVVTLKKPSETHEHAASLDCGCLLEWDGPPEAPPCPIHHPKNCDPGKHPKECACYGCMHGRSGSNY